MSNVNTARALRKKVTWAERQLWRLLRHRRFNGYKFRRQHACGPYTLDFYCAEAKLSIELDGGGHGYPGRMASDRIRDAYLAGNSITVLRFWNHTLRTNPEGLRTMIFQALQERAPH